MRDTVKTLDVIIKAAMLLGNDRASVHPEYSRAIAELVNELTGTGAADDVAATEEMLWAIAEDKDN